MSETFLWEKGLELSFPPKIGDSTRVLWWNIQYGHCAHEISNGLGRNPLEENIRALVEHPDAPDVVILGEQSENAFGRALLRTLEESYPFHTDGYIPYNQDTPEMGIGMYSKEPIELKKSTLLDYYPLHLDSEEKIASFKATWANGYPQERYFPRHYLRFELRSKHGSLDLLPFHSLVHVEKELTQAGSQFFRKSWIKLRFVFAKNTPLNFQFQRLRDCLNQDYGPHLDSKPFLLIGDFNHPPSIFGLQSTPNRILSEGLRQCRLIGPSYTWPMPSSAEAQRHKVKVMIDLALHSSQMRNHGSWTLPLLGSDHAAIMVDISNSRVAT